MKQKLFKGVALFVAIPFFIHALHEPKEEESRPRRYAMAASQLRRMASRNGSSLRRDRTLNAATVAAAAHMYPTDYSPTGAGYGSTAHLGRHSNGSRIVSTKSPLPDLEKERVGR